MSIFRHIKKRREIAFYKEKLLDLGQRLFTPNHVGFMLDDTIQNSDGELEILNDKKFVHIGWKDMDKTEDIKQAFANSVFVTQHEYRHVEQGMSIEQGKASDEMLYCYLATGRDNQNYYEQNYSLDYNELDADKFATYATLSYLKENFSSTDAVRAVKTFLRNKESMYSGWESEIDKIQTIDDFDKYLFGPYEKKLLATRKDRYNTKNDEFNTFIDRHREPLNECGDLRYDSIFASDDYRNTDCDKFVAAISKELHPERADFYKNCTAYHDLSLKQIVADYRKTHKTKAEEQAERYERQISCLNELQVDCGYRGVSMFQSGKI